MKDTKQLNTRLQNGLFRGALKSIFVQAFLMVCLTFSTQGQPSKAILAMNPVGYWPADEGEGTVLRDLSPNKNHAELHNVNWDGKLLNFRGLFQWAEIPASDKYNSRKLSFGGWVFLRDKVQGGWNSKAQEGLGMTFMGNGYHTSSYTLDTLDQDEVIFMKSKWSVNGGYPDGASIRLRRSERVDILSGGKDDALKTAGKADQVAIGKWQHILYTYESPAKVAGGKEWVSLQDTKTFYNAGTAKLYVNGELVKSSNRVEFQPRMAPFLVGADAWWWLQAVTSGSLDGSVRDLVIFDRTISQGEVATLYNKTRPGVKPHVFAKDTVLIDESPVELKDLDDLSPEQAWEVLQQLVTFDKQSLKKYTPWLKTQKDAVAVKLLLKLGENTTVEKLIPQLVNTFKTKALHEEKRADSLLALAECKGLAKELALKDMVAELKTLKPQTLKIEDYYRNALIYAVSEIDPKNEILKTFVAKPDGRFFSQGDEMRDSRHGKGTDYSSSAVYQGKIYRVGTGVAWHGVEAVSDEEFEDIAKEVEAGYPNVRRWAEGKDLSRVYMTQTDASGKEERIYPLGRKFIFDKTDGKMKGWSIAIDKDGYVHLTGGMHNAPDEKNFMPGSWESWGMSRELKNDKYPTMPYWVSKTPGDVSSFDFVGHRDNKRNIPVVLGMNYMSFVQDRTKELFIYGRIYVQGLQSWGLYKYDAKTKTWEGLGGFAPDVKKEFPVWSDRFIKMAADGLALASIRWKNTHEKSKVLAWSRQPHFYNFIRGWAVRWDTDNRMHVQVPMFALDKNNRDTNMQLYAYSDDGGNTFHRADGKELPLPLTANQGGGNASIQTSNNLKRYNLWVSLLKKSGYKTGFKTF